MTFLREDPTFRATHRVEEGVTTLHERLADLAIDAPPGGPLPDLWRRGRRIARVRRLGTAAIATAACVALLVVVALGWQRGRPAAVVPAGPTSAPAMPDRLFEPSGWLGSLDPAPGVLAAVFETRREHLFGSEPGVVGVSAATGRYGFLDLPRLADRQGVALSPDGRRLAYWTAGTPSGSPNTSGGETITGYAVFDAASGHTERVGVPTKHGLTVGTLAWLDDRTLLVQYGHWDGGDGDDAMARSSAQMVPPRLWRLEAPAGPLPAGSDAWSLDVAGHGRVLWSTEDTRGLYDAMTGRTQPLRGSWPRQPAINPGGRLIAGPASPDTPGPLQIVDLQGHVRARPSGDVYSALYWLDDEHLVADPRAEGPEPSATLAVLDLGTLRWSTVVEGATPGNLGRQRYAFELLANPTRQGAAPPRPLGARAVAGWSATVVVLGGLVLLAWRRRVRP